MADIFVSYAREDRGFAEQLARSLAGCGWSVWWDRKIHAGQSFSDVIERELDQARCVVVLWSRSSIGSEWVINEAAEGARRRILVPILIDDVRLPLEFRRLHAANLVKRDTSDSEPDFVDCIEAIRTLLQKQHGEEPANVGRSSDPTPVPAENTAATGLSSRRRMIALAAVAIALMIIVAVVAISLLPERETARNATVPSPESALDEDTAAPEPANSTDQDTFQATTRRGPRLSIPDARIEEFISLDELFASLPADEAMIRHWPPVLTDASAPRVKEEQRLVRVQAWLYAASHEDSNDYLLIIGTDPGGVSQRYMIAAVSGLPPPGMATRRRLQAARDSFKRFFGDALRPGSTYDFYDPPIGVRIDGAPYFDIAHAKGTRPGPQSLRANIPSLWQIRPITKIDFERPTFSSQ